MEPTDYKDILIPNVKKLLKELGKSHKWLNEQIYGVSESGQPKNNFFRKDQKVRNYLIVTRVAQLLNISVNDLLRNPSQDSKPSLGSTIESKEDITTHEDLIKCFKDPVLAKYLNELLLDIEGMDYDYLSREIKNYLEGIRSVLKSKYKKSKTIL